jgi:AcrR family transcriptional regulator
MVRDYDSSRRKEAAWQTREAILRAAFELHGQGIIDLKSLATAADVSAATIRKHFPNREMLLAGCIEYGLALAPMPDVAGLAALTDPREQLITTIRQAFALHESLFGQLWLGLKFEDELPAVAETWRQIEATVDSLAAIIVSAWPDRPGGASEFGRFVAGILSPLTYRALRRHDRLSPEQATSATTRLLLDAFETDAGKAEQEATHH